ncbi:hypothetical protein TRFO_16078 [Tritrichomonas foetus]|uniref:Uncharacterized protein n=1 Tax=Tritrichomonas foetus TaxID=1144522 RepID=A0A1J4KR71_9EUKA|nr:hypothetical protein TRFO_16078 [Tritrichomonas foetus]|eukprot:OHT13747.1 hypothetical protein TRFO_16078 [Tritrichomonas foetus]
MTISIIFCELDDQFFSHFKLNEMSSPQLTITLVDWRNIKVPKFTASAFHICDFLNGNKETIMTQFGPLEGVIFTGSNHGEVLRWIIYKDGVIPATVAFGHNSKIIQFAECAFPIIQNGIASLSYDGTICVWSVIDGICIRQFENILPKGCQRIAISNSAIEVAAVSGSFPNIYIVNIQTGEITQVIRPVSKFPICLDFYSTEKSEWLFVMDSNGCATYTTLTPTTSTSHRVGIFAPDKESLIGAYPSPDFSFIILVSPHGYAVVELFNKSFPHFVDYEFPDIQTVVWLDPIVFALFKYDGSFYVYSLSPPYTRATHADIIESIEYSKHSPSISSIFLDKKSSEIEDIKKKQIHLLNPLQKIPHSISRFRSHAVFNEENTKYILKPQFWWKGESNIPLILVSVFDKQVAFAFDDCVILSAKQFQEYYLKDVFALEKAEKSEKNEKSKKSTEKKSRRVRKGSRSHKEHGHKRKDSIKDNDISEYSSIDSTNDVNKYGVMFDDIKDDGEDMVTAQCYYLEKKTCIAVIEGKNNGVIRIKYFNGQKKKRLKVHHKGRVVALCTRKRFLFSSGKDCVLNVFSLENFALLTVYPHFVSPVTSFLSVDKKTHTSIDKCLFCLTADGKISVIDISTPKTQLLFILSGHESSVERIYFHPPTKLLLVQCRSLYFWSMITGNLESIMNGHQMFKYIDNAKDSLVEVTRLFTSKKGVRYIPTRFGSLNLHVPEIDISSLAKNVQTSLKKHKNDDLKTALLHVPNFPLLYNLLSGKAKKALSAECKFDFHSDSKMSFSGANHVTTVYLIPFKGKNHWQVSPQITTTILAARIVFSYILREHSFIENNWNKMFRKSDSLFQKVTNFQHPDFYYLVKFCIDSPLNIHQYIYRLLQTHMYDERKKWVTNILSAASVFPNQKEILQALSSVIKASLIDSMDGKQISNLAQSLYNIQANRHDKIGIFSREIIGLYLDKMTQYIPDMKILLYNVLRDNNYQTSSQKIIDYFVQNIQSKSLDYCRKSLEKNDKKVNLSIFNNLTNTIISYPKNDFIEDCALLLIDACIYANYNDLIPLFTKINENTSWFYYQSDSKTFAIGTRVGYLFVYKYNNGTLIKGELKLGKHKKIDSVVLDKRGSNVYLSVNGKGVIKVTISLIEIPADESKSKKDEKKLKLIESSSLIKSIKEQVELKWVNSTTLNVISESNKQVIETIDLKQKSSKE